MDIVRRNKLLIARGVGDFNLGLNSFLKHHKIRSNEGGLGGPLTSFFFFFGSCPFLVAKTWTSGGPI